MIDIPVALGRKFRSNSSFWLRVPAWSTVSWVSRTLHFYFWSYYWAFPSLGCFWRDDFRTTWLCSLPACTFPASCRFPSWDCCCSPASWPLSAHFRWFWFRSFCSSWFCCRVLVSTFTGQIFLYSCPWADRSASTAQSSASWFCSRSLSPSTRWFYTRKVCPLSCCIWSCSHLARLTGFWAHCWVSRFLWKGWRCSSPYLWVGFRFCGSHWYHSPTWIWCAWILSSVLFASCICPKVLSSIFKCFRSCWWFVGDCCSGPSSLLSLPISTWVFHWFCRFRSWGCRFLTRSCKASFLDF